MEMEDFLDHEIFDLKPILPEIYSYQPQTTTTSKPAVLSKTTALPASGTTSRPTRHLLSQTEAAASNPTISSKLLSFDGTSTERRPYDNTNPNLGGAYTSTMTANNNDGVVKPQIINFSSMVENDLSNIEYDNLEESSAGQIRRGVTVNRTPMQAQDHVLAERKRRQKLGQLFISLSKVVPGLKKLDKASLLEDAIDHLKSLQERVNVLEEEKKKRSSSTVANSSSSSNTMEDSSTTNDHVDEYDIEEGDMNMMSRGEAAPEIKAMMSNDGSTVLIKIWCKNQKGLMSRIPWEMEKMYLTVRDMRIMPFGDATLVITILAQMQKEFLRGTAVQDIIERVEMVLLNPEP